MAISQNAKTIDCMNWFILAASDREFAAGMGVFLGVVILMYAISWIGWKVFSAYDANHSDRLPSAFRELWAVELSATGERLYILDTNCRQGERAIAHPDIAWREFIYPMHNDPSLGRCHDRWNLSMANVLAASLRDSRPGEDWQPIQVTRRYGPVVWLLLVGGLLFFLYMCEKL